MRRLSADGFIARRVLFNPADWMDTPHRMTVGDQVVKLGAFTTQHHHTIMAVESGGWGRVTIRDDSPAPAVPGGLSRTADSDQ